MNGAREYAELFKSGQYGRFYIESGRHARGRYFHLWLLPSDAPIDGGPRGRGDTVEVYGITGGQPGWTETYGWLYRGKWEQDFDELVKCQKDKVAAFAAEQKQRRDALEEIELRRKTVLLEKY